MSRVGKRYMAELTGAMAGYAAALVATLLVLQMEPPAPLGYLAALLPVLPIAYGMRAYARFLGGIDELQRRIQLDGLAFAVGGAGLITVAWGFLELAGLPRLPAIWVFPLMIWLWGIGTALATRRYR